MRSASCSAKVNKNNFKGIFKKKDNKIIIIFESKSFLQKQVRSMVGCLKYVGEKNGNQKKLNL